MLPGLGDFEFFKQEGAKLARRTNYSAGKRQKELNRANRKKQKDEEKRARKAATAGTLEPGDAAGSEAPEDGADTQARPSESGPETGS